jgi:hypothetical protein
MWWPGHASLVDVCKVQLQTREVPVACFIQFHRHPSAFGKDLTDILNRHCVRAIRTVQKIDQAKDFARHPDLSTECRHAAEIQLRKLRYRHEDTHPWEVVESFFGSE